MPVPPTTPPAIPAEVDALLMLVADALEARGVQTITWASEPGSTGPLGGSLRLLSFVVSGSDIVAAPGDGEVGVTIPAGAGVTVLLQGWAIADDDVALIPLVSPPASPPADPTTHRVASVDDVDRLLPVGVRGVPTDARYEAVWMVNIAADAIDGGSVVDTELSRYFTFALTVAPDGSGDAIATSEWLPCDDPDGV